MNTRPTLSFRGWFLLGCAYTRNGRLARILRLLLQGPRGLLDREMLLPTVLLWQGHGDGRRRQLHHVLPLWPSVHALQLRQDRRKVRCSTQATSATAASPRLRLDGVAPFFAQSSHLIIPLMPLLAPYRYGTNGPNFLISTCCCFCCPHLLLWMQIGAVENAAGGTFGLLGAFK